MFHDSTSKSNITVSLKTLSQLKALRDTSPPSPQSTSEDDDDDDVIFLMLTYTTSYDSVHYPFGVQRVEGEYDGDREIERLRGVVAGLEKMGEGGEEAEEVSKNETSN
ncbi:hypothetical protein TL16_g01708 [Triparma laevis f. inornata]|uniref:Uncharacterized protein n=1 Tax=Triparma laevis f. inornata TaxID=1714386 RepID=A0A9W7DUD5_9STRA|nr:hypothetical protein TL16_g01708 [Triparma laevis f. inornata]